MKRLIPFLILSVFTANASFSQEKDAELWTGIEIQKRITKDFNAGIKEGLRLNENFGQLKTLYTQLWASYSVSKYIRFKGIYRFIQRQDASLRHRYSAEATFRYKKKPFVFYYRSRFQTQYEYFSTAETTTSSVERHSRNRFLIKFDLDKEWMPYFGTELWYRFTNSDQQGSGLDNFRFGMGIEYKLSKYHDLRAGYYFDQELNQPNPLQSHIFALNYVYTFGKAKKKKEKEIDVPDIRPSVD